jgi:aspartyl-tRNA(Asn)/glutamyl-tRNA(Gln) amidotransferase subunit A
MHQYLTLSSVQTDIKEGKLQLVELVENFLQRIEEKKHLNAFVEVYAEEAKERAALIQEKIMQGTAGKLGGMVLGIKDLICYKGHNISAGSKILEN